MFINHYDIFMHVSSRVCSKLLSCRFCICDKFFRVTLLLLWRKLYNKVLIYSLRSKVPLGNVLSLDRVNLNFKQIRKHEKKFFWLLVELMSLLADV